MFNIKKNIIKLIYMDYSNNKFIRKNNKNYPVYKTDFKFKQYRNLKPEDYKRVIIDEDMDSINYRMKECKESNYTSLDLSNLNLKEIPDIIPKNLKYLFISNNKLTSLKKLVNLKYLEVLDCSSNKLTSLKYIPNTTELNCRNNLLINIDDLINCNRLTKLDCSHNNIHNIIPLNSLELLNVVIIN